MAHILVRKKMTRVFSPAVSWVGMATVGMLSEASRQISGTQEQGVRGKFAVVIAN